jgi:hypothetical protein
VLGDEKKTNPKLQERLKETMSQDFGTLFFSIKQLYFGPVNRGFDFAEIFEYVIAFFVISGVKAKHKKYPYPHIFARM